MIARLTKWTETTVVRLREERRLRNNPATTTKQRRYGRKTHAKTHSGETGRRGGTSHSRGDTAATSAQYADMVAAAIGTLTEWCVRAPWLLKSPELARDIVSLASAAANEDVDRNLDERGGKGGGEGGDRASGRDGDSDQRDRGDVQIRRAGSELLHVLLCDIARDESGGGELPAGSVAVSALLAEEDALRRACHARDDGTDDLSSSMSPEQADGLVSFFSLRQGTCILSVIELPVRACHVGTRHSYGAVT